MLGMGKKGKKKGERGQRRLRERKLSDTVLSVWLAARESANLLARDFESGQEGVDPGDNWLFCGESSMVFGQRDASSLIGPLVKHSVRDARIFILKPSLFGTYYREADVYTTTEIAGMEWAPEGIGNVTEEEALDHYHLIAEAGKKVPPPDPERWPFPCLWIAFGEGIPLTAAQTMARLQAQTIDSLKPKGVMLMAQLWAQYEGGVFIADVLDVETDNENGRLSALLWGVVYFEGKWNHPYDLNPWICNAIHQHLLDYKTVIVEKNWSAHQARSMTNPSKEVVRPPIPPPFYLVNLQSKVVERDFRRTIPRRQRMEYQHSFSVRGHERVRVRRGPLPLSEEDREALHARKYDIYTLAPLSQRHAQLLADRGIQGKRTGEWMAILVSWVKDHRRGPDNAPFVPAVRVA